MEQLISEYLLKLMTIIFLAGATYLGINAAKLYKKYVDTEIKQTVCRTAVRFVEQIYKDLHGEEKLQKAMEKASELLKEKKIYISADELIALLESAVNEFNNAFGKDKLAETNQAA